MRIGHAWGNSRERMRRFKASFLTKRPQVAHPACYHVIYIDLIVYIAYCKAKLRKCSPSACHLSRSKWRPAVCHPGALGIDVDLKLLQSL